MSVPDRELLEFAHRLEQIQRDNTALLANLFSMEVVGDNPRRHVCAHVLRADGNNDPNVGLLVRELANVVLDYCVPPSLAAEALDDLRTRGSYRRLNALFNEARLLFSNLKTSGEGGELLLFLLAESVLQYRQVVAKMALKTSAPMHFHGLDGIYVSCGGEKLRLHYGESKVHSDSAKSVREAAASVAPYLADQGNLAASRRDAFLLNTQVDFNDEQLRVALLGFLDPWSPHYRSPEICGVILCGYDLTNFPSLARGAEVPDGLLKHCMSRVELLEDELDSQEVSHFHIDVFLVPFPSVSDFRSKLIGELGI